MSPLFSKKPSRRLIDVIVLAILGVASSSCWPKPQVPNACVMKQVRKLEPTIEPRDQCSLEERTWQNWQSIWFAMDEPDVWVAKDDKLVFRVARYFTLSGIVVSLRAEIIDGKGEVVVKRMSPFGYQQAPEIKRISKRPMDEREVLAVTECVAGRSEWRFASELQRMYDGIYWIAEASDRGSYAATIWTSGDLREPSEEPAQLGDCFDGLAHLGLTWW